MQEKLEEKDDYQDELRRLAVAGFALVQCKYSKINFQLANNTNTAKSTLTDNLGGFLPLLPVAKDFIEALSQDHEGLILKKLKVPEHGKPIDGFTPPEFPPVKNLRGEIWKCGTPFEKQLTTSDVKDDQSRLTISKDLVQEFIYPMMKAEEKELSRKIDGIEVVVYDSKGNQYKMKFKMWSSGKSQVLTSGWKKFCKYNKFLAHEDWITIWAFRKKEDPEKLCFAILARRFPKIKQLVPKKSGSKREINVSSMPESIKRKRTD